MSAACGTWVCCTTAMHRYRIEQFDTFSVAVLIQLFELV
jgi:hypothetical protein